MVQDNTPASEVAISQPRFDDDTLASIKSFGDAIKSVEHTGEAVLDLNDFGSGFVVTEKDVLVGTPFFIVEWRFNEGKFEDAFVSASLVTEDGRKLIINDGGTGVCRQLEAITRRTGKQRGLLVKGGLSRSDYTRVVEGKNVPSTTFYLATS